MKTFRFLSVLLAVFVLWSCSGSGSEDIPEPVKPEEKPEMITVSLKLSGEYMSISESPMGRADNSSRVYGINVYYKDDKSTSWKHYGYGLFDNTNDMTISLISSYSYKFDCTMAEDNIDKLFYSGTSNRKYIYPFRSTYTDLTNKFIVSTTSDTYLEGIKNGKSTLITASGSTSNHVDYPRIDRFYGELEDYVPSESNGPTIDMKRTAFGIKVLANAPSDGKLTLSNDDLGTIAQISSEDSDYESEAIYTFKEVYKCWAGTTTEQEFTLKLTWKRENGVSQEFTKNVTVKRNVMTTINIDVTSTTASSNLKLNIDSTPMEVETINWNIEA